MRAFKYICMGVLLTLLLGTVNQGRVVWALDLHKAREKRVDLYDTIGEKYKEIRKLEDTIKDAKVRIEEIQEEVEPLEEDYRHALHRLQGVNKVFNEWLSRNYRKGETNYLASLFQAFSLQELLHRWEFMRLVTKEGYYIVKERKQVLAEVEKRKKVYDDRIQEQQQCIDAAKKAYLSLQEALQKDQQGLEEVRKVEEAHHDEVVQINLKEWKEGTLRFPYVGPLEYPTKGTKKSSGYGYRTMMGGTSRHEGIDYAGPKGTPVYAAADGVVVSSRASAGYGWLITIYHGEYNGKSIFTRYAHSYPNQVRVVVGQQVYKGKTHITSIGSNGFSTGYHLHFEVRIGDGDRPPSDNPENWLRK